MMLALALTKVEEEQLRRVADHYGTSLEGALRMLLRREDHYGQAAIVRVRLGIPIASE
jgi:hypothetical protein